MPDRRAQVILLIGSRFDGLYLPPGSLVTPAGLVPAEREPCVSCGGVLIRDDFGKEIRRAKGRGWVKDRFQRRVPCSACGEVGWIARDPMDSQGVRVGSVATSATARPRQTVECDACGGDGVRRGERCVRCDGVGRRDLHVFELHLDTRDVDERDPLLTAIETRNAAGSYAELERALVGIARHVNKPAVFAPLTRVAPGALRLLDEVFLPPADRVLDELEEGERQLVELSLRYVVWRMPERIRVPAQVVANARELREQRKRVRGRQGLAAVKRNSEIRQLVRRGSPSQHIAVEYGLSVAQVNRIVAGEDAAA